MELSSYQVWTCKIFICHCYFPVHFLMEILFSITNNLVPVLADHPVRTQAYVLQAGYRVRIQHELLEAFRHQGVLLLLLMPICKVSSSARPWNKLPLSGEDSATLGEIPDPFLFVMKRKHGQHTPFPSPSGYKLLRAPCENNPDFSILPVQGLGRYICTLSWHTPLQTFLNTIIIWFIVVFFRPKQLFLQFEFQPCLFLFTSLQIPITQRRLLAPYIANKHIFTWCKSQPEFLLETASKEEPVPPPLTRSVEAPSKVLLSSHHAGKTDRNENDFSKSESQKSTI